VERFSFLPFGNRLGNQLRSLFSRFDGAKPPTTKLTSLGARSKNTEFKLSPIGLRELPMWLLAVAFVTVASGDYKPVRVAQELDPNTLQLLSEPEATGVEIRLSQHFSSVAPGAATAITHVREKFCRPNTATDLPTGLSNPNTPAATSNGDAC
jgi:hypothetical protein